MDNYEKKLEKEDLQRALKERGCENIQELESLIKTGCSHMKIFREVEKHKVKNYSQLLVIKALDALPDNTVLKEDEIKSKMYKLHEGYDKIHSWASKNHYLCMKEDCDKSSTPEKDVKYRPDVNRGGTRRTCHGRVHDGRNPCKGELTQSKYYIQKPDQIQLYQGMRKYPRIRTKKIGRWDEKKSHFIKGFNPGYQIEYQTVVIDGPNVAKTPDGVAKLDRILNAKKKMEKADLNVLVVVSAATRYQIDDRETLEKMIKDGHIIKAASKEDDDYFAINIAFEENAYLLSNDRHRDWKDAYPSKAAELEMREVKFTIYGDTKVSPGRPLGNIDIS